MKPLLTILFVFLCTTSHAQLKRFLIQGQVVDQNNNPVSDVYIVNLSNHEKDISLANGVFTFWVSPTDSMVFSHISFYRKIVSVHTLLVNPRVQLTSESRDIKEVIVSPDQKSEYDRAMANLEFMNTYDTPIRARMKEEQPDPVLTIMTENNDLMRSEAASIRLFQFSPSENIGKLFTALKKKERSNQNFSSQKELMEVETKKFP